MSSSRTSWKACGEMSSLLDLSAARACTHPVVDGEDDGGVDHAAQLHQDKDPADEGDIL